MQFIFWHQTYCSQLPVIIFFLPILKEVNKAGKQNEYGNLFNEFEAKYNEIAPYALSRDYFFEVVLRNTELLTIGFRLYQLEQVYNMRGEQSFNDRKANTIAALEGTYKDYNKNVDEKVFEKLIELYATKSPQQFLPAGLINANYKALTNNIYTESKLTSYDGLKELLNGGVYTNDTPVAIVYKATWNDQKTIVGTIGTIASKVKEARIVKTALIIVGDVIAPKEYEFSKVYDSQFTHGYRRSKEAISGS